MTGDTIAKVLFTSGSTGRPKGVINTQRMLCANQEQLRTVLAFLADAPPVLCDWLPWNHTFGGNHNFGIVLYNGGTLYLDEGRPVPGQMERTLANLREIATTAYFNVPRGFEMLLPALRQDADFQRLFFSRLGALFFAAAGLRPEIADGMQDLAVATRGRPVPWITGLGATESAPMALVHRRAAVDHDARRRAVPGLELKAAPVGDVLEARLRGPNITPGYWGDEELTRAAFDDEGYYRMGDAIAPADPDDVSKGFMFRGRINEDFKLSTGTWVRVGTVRARLLAALGEIAQDVVITGHERDRVGVLVFPNVAACRASLPHTRLDLAMVICAIPPSGRHSSHGSRRINETCTGSSTHCLAGTPARHAAVVRARGNHRQRVDQSAHRRRPPCRADRRPVPGRVARICWSTWRAAA